MVTFPNCKINIGLNITGKRDDGFHNLETVFCPVPVIDALEIIPSVKFSYDQSGLLIDNAGKNNLCIKAYEILRKDYNLPPVSIHLHKAIPVGAGLGGGSADAAFTLQALNTLFSLGISKETLSAYALQTGSDCPFFLINKPCYASGRGEILEEITMHLSGYKIIIVNPGIHINTSWAFSQLKNFNSGGLLKENISAPVETWKLHIKNDFEPIVFEEYIEVKEIAAYLYNNGALYASLSGTGSSVFGIFKSNMKTDHIKFPSEYFSRWV